MNNREGLIAWQVENMAALRAAGFEVNMDQIDWIGSEKREVFKDIRRQRDTVAEEKAALCLQIGVLCNKVPKTYQRMTVDGVREFKAARAAAMKVAGNKRASINELTAALSSMQRFA